MKISEITDQNQMWAYLKEMNTSYSELYATIHKVVELLITQRSPQRIRVFLPTVKKAIRDMQEFVDEPFPDATDPDIVQEKERVREMVISLSEMIKRLPL